MSWRLNGLRSPVQVNSFGINWDTWWWLRDILDTLVEEELLVNSQHRLKEVLSSLEAIYSQIKITYFSDTNLLDTADRAASRSSLDSHETVQSEGIFDKFRTHIASIVKGANTNGSATSELDSGVTQINLDSDEVDPGDTTEEPIKVQPESPSEYLRILSRSESAGDANIIDKLQQNNKKNCSRSLQFNGEKENEQVDNKDSPTK